MITFKEQGSSLIFIIPLILLILILGGVFYLKNNISIKNLPSPQLSPYLTSPIPTSPSPMVSPSPDVLYKEITLKELMTNPEKFKEQKVMINGKYMARGWIAEPQCRVGSTSSQIIIKDDYINYPAKWYIDDGDLRLSVIVINDQVTQINTLPNYLDNQAIALKGVVKVEIINPGGCSPPNINYHSVYLQVKSEDVGLTSKK